jgi:hypothetical protein
MGRLLPGCGFGSRGEVSVCELVFTRTALGQLEDKRQASHRAKLEPKLRRFAEDGSRTAKSFFDYRGRTLKDMPQELRHVKKLRIGRHRIYFRGASRDCRYRIGWINYTDQHDKDQIEQASFRQKLAKSFGENDAPSKP